MLSLHMAWLLRDDPDIEVVGLLLVDTPLPVRDEKKTPPAAPVPPPTVGAEGKPLRRNEVLALQAMGAARDMIQAWTMPNWTASKTPLPPAVLVRAKGVVPEKDPGATAAVDRSRSDPKLGWCAWEGHDLVREVVDVEGHHYDIFTFARVSATSTGIKKACAVLESFGAAA
jgi:hypothetical protein